MNINTIMNTDAITITATKGNGSAIHGAAVTYNHSLATLCDTIGANFGRGVQYRPSSEPVVTCKSCLKIIKKLDS